MFIVILNNIILPVRFGIHHDDGECTAQYIMSTLTTDIIVKQWSSCSVRELMGNLNVPENKSCLQRSSQNVWNNRKEFKFNTKPGIFVWCWFIVQNCIWKYVALVAAYKVSHHIHVYVDVVWTLLLQTFHRTFAG